MSKVVTYRFYRGKRMVMVIRNYPRLPEEKIQAMKDLFQADKVECFEEGKK